MPKKVTKKECTYSCTYAFTITILPKHYYLPGTEQYDLVVDSLISILRDIGVCSTLIAENTKAWNIHFHGMIKFETTDKRRKPCEKRFHDAFRGSRFFGHVNISQCMDRDTWETYIKKDIQLTRASIDRPPVILDDYEIIPFEELTCRPPDYMDQ